MKTKFVIPLEVGPSERYYWQAIDAILKKKYSERTLQERGFAASLGIGSYETPPFTIGDDGGGNVMLSEAPDGRETQVRILARAIQGWLRVGERLPWGANYIPGQVYAELPRQFPNGMEMVELLHVDKERIHIISAKKALELLIPRLV